ncbi:chromosome partitioning ATPase-like protein [Pirellula staleyi DSM 6068]|uniref:Chromosome partitioning ATPase-like protein n=1 Tax=Pirellula staleyi (strain ATCC 27377 / DSM 6068 / ICPB 4128) TaxID=530564 RepID=D2QZ26_PIRSD|nr:P-loop NTPase [Pirellula staleyi]ADB18218.1 chromosome partitioning ATPase-like protein [Pirellula staleyi DSM 6068]
MDQATQLRSLMLRAARQAADELATPPQTVVVAAGRAAAGCTTVALNLAYAFASQGLRTVLVDAHWGQGDIAPLCRIESSVGLADVLTLQKDIHEVLTLGPCGVQVVTCSAVTKTAFETRGVQKLLRQIRSLSRYADVVVVDAGTGRSELSTGLWQAADELLLVTTPDAVAVMDSYALVKSLVNRQAVTTRLSLVVNQSQSAEEAADVHRRIDQSCSRFLGLRLPMLGWLERSSEPLLLRSTSGNVANQIDGLVEVIHRRRDATQASRRAA